MSYDDGTTWQPIATGVALNRFGQGTFLWTPTQASTGNTRADPSHVAGSVQGTIQRIPGRARRHAFYVNDGSQAGDQYTTAVGNDANSGKDPADPMASLGALTRAYKLAGGDTVYVDTGNYSLLSDLVFGANDQGSSAANPLVIQGPTNGGQAVLNRNNTASTANVVDVSGLYITWRI